MTPSPTASGKAAAFTLAIVLIEVLQVLINERPHPAMVKLRPSLAVVITAKCTTLLDME